MHSTKTQMLLALKRNGRCSVDELALMLGVAPMTVRQHLAALERDSLIASTEERGRLGRPHFVYFLTPRGEESFPKHYDRLAMQLLQEIGSLDAADLVGRSAAEKAEMLLDRIADRFIAQHGPRVRGLSFAERVAAVGALLHAESGFAEWERTAEGFEIRDFNCAYRPFAVVGENNDACCRWHQRVLSALLDVEVHTAACSGLRSDHVCRCVVRPDDGAGTRPSAASGAQRGAPALA
jgi:predicted ArsR family transcriptional regulator